MQKIKNEGNKMESSEKKRLINDNKSNEEKYKFELNQQNKLIEIFNKNYVEINHNFIEHESSLMAFLKNTINRSIEILKEKINAENELIEKLNNLNNIMEIEKHIEELKQQFNKFKRFGERFQKDEFKNEFGITQRNVNLDLDYLNKLKDKNLRNNLFNTDNEENNQKNILNRIIPPVTNFKNFDNESKDNTYNYNNLTSTFFYPKDNNLFRISAQQRNQKANMNKYYSNQKMKDFFYFKNHKNINSTKNLFSSKAQNEDYNKFIMECQNKNRISFFKKNDYNPRIKSKNR